MTAFSTALASPAAIPLITPIGKVTGTVFSYLAAESNTAHALKQIRKVDPFVQQAVELLAYDFKIIGDLSEQQFSEWIKLRHSNLRIIYDENIAAQSGEIKSGSSSYAEMYKIYKASRKQASAVQASVNAGQKYEKLLRSLARAHHSIAKGGDPDFNIEQFLNFANELIGSANQLKAAAGG